MKWYSPNLKGDNSITTTIEGFSENDSVFAYINNEWKDYSPEKLDFLNTLKEFKQDMDIGLK